MPVLGIGAWILRLRQRFAGGIRATWFRERIRPRILETPSILVPDHSPYEIHALTSNGDWLNLLWALKSFYHQSGETPALCIHDDGTLDDFGALTLAEHFPGARVLLRGVVDAEVVPALGNYPRCLALRDKNPLSLKAFDVPYYAQAETVLLLDSDILFFAHPEELVRRLRDGSPRNYFNRDVADAYTSPREQLNQAFGETVAERFNSGLCVLRSDSLNLDWMEEFLGDIALDGHFWRIEQTLLALCSSRSGTEPLSAAYDVRLERGLEGRVAKHYVGAIRRDLYREGMRELWKRGFLEQVGRLPQSAEATVG